MQKNTQQGFVFWGVVLFCLVLAPVIRVDNRAVAQAVHPRLFFSAADIPTLQSQGASTHQDILQPILEYSSSLIPAAPPAPPVSSDIGEYARASNQLIVLAFSCTITGVPAFCDTARDYLINVTGWPSWDIGVERGRALAHMVLGTSIAYDWLYPQLSPAEQALVRTSLAGRAQQLYEASTQPYRTDWNNWWAKSYLQNHYWLCNSALGLAGMTLLGDEIVPTFSPSEWLATATDKFTIGRYVLEGIADGSWHESIHYQNYFLAMSLPFWVNLRDLHGVDLLPHQYLQNYVTWRLYNHLPDTTHFILPFGDMEWSWSNSNSPQHVLRFIAQEYTNSTAEWLAQELITAGTRIADVYATPWYVFEFLYYDPAISAASPVGLPRSSTFSDTEAAVWRTGWTADDLVFALNTGAPGGRFAFDTFTQGQFPWEPPCIDNGCDLNTGHDHEDANSITIYGARQWLLPEMVGVGLTDTSFHNTLLIDGQGQYRPPDFHGGAYEADFIGRDGFIESTASSAGMDYVAADATGRYALPDLLDYTRHVVFVRPDYFVVLDHLAAAAPHRYEFVVHFGGPVSQDGDWLRGETDNGLVMGVAVAAPQPYQVVTGNDGIPYARTAADVPVANDRLVHVLYPTYATQWADRPAVSVLGDSGEAVVVRVEMNDGSDQIDDTLINYVDDPALTAVGAYRFDGRVAVVRTTANGDLSGLMVNGGSLIESTELGVVLAANLSPAGSYDIIYQGRLLAIQGNVPEGARFYAPDVQEVTVNNVPRRFSREGDYIIIGGTAADSAGGSTTAPVMLSPATTGIPLPVRLPATGYTADGESYGEREIIVLLGVVALGLTITAMIRQCEARRHPG
jgi:hypothetical protein